MKEPSILFPHDVEIFFANKRNFEVLEQASSSFSGVLLDVGCGRMPYRNYLLSPATRVTEYIGLDLKNNQYDTEPDLTWNGAEIPLPDSSIDTVIATQVLEHIPLPDVVLREIFRVLKQGGVFFFTVPFLWPLHDVPNDEYRYTPFSLQRHLANAGFSAIQIYAYGGWDASLATMLALWITRRPMSRWKRRIMSHLLFPIIKYLHCKDVVPTDFSESPMINAIWGMAKKNAK